VSHKANDNFMEWAAETFGELQEAKVLSDQEIAEIKQLMDDKEFETLGGALSTYNQRLHGTPDGKDGDDIFDKPDIF
jgi:hypothetical protein